MADIVLGIEPGSDQVQQRKARAECWNEKKRGVFLGELAATANVRAAARAAGMSEQAAYQLRKREAAFAVAWGTALCEGYAKLEMLMLERAIAGMAGRDVAAGDTAGAVMLSERTILTLLTQHRQTVRDLRAAGAVADPGNQDGATLRTQIAGRLEAMHERLKAIDGGE